MMLHVPGDTFNIDSVMRLNQLAETNFQIAGTWGDKKTAWRVFLHEPSDSLSASWFQAGATKSGRSA